MSRPQGTNEELKRAEKALKEVNNEIKRIEDKKKKLAKAAEGTGVKAMRAKNELEQLLAADQVPPSPLSHKKSLPNTQNPPYTA